MPRPKKVLTEVPSEVLNETEPVAQPESEPEVSAPSPTEPVLIKTSGNFLLFSTGKGWVLRNKLKQLIGSGTDPEEGEALLRGLTRKV